MNPYLSVYRKLFKRYGPQHWWPAETPFEVMVGSVLTQNTAWTNVEKAIANLKHFNALDAQTIVDAPHENVAEWIRPSGYFNIKTKRLKNFCHWYLDEGGYEPLQQLDTHELRKRVLSVNGVGYETADDIVLYAFDRPVFVIDAYTKRIFSRLGLTREDVDYEELRHEFEANLKSTKDKVQVFNEYHALIVIHAKAHCSKKPACEGCPLYSDCGY